MSTSEGTSMGNDLSIAKFGFVDSRNGTRNDEVNQQKQKSKMQITGKERKSNENGRILEAKTRRKKDKSRQMQREKVTDEENIEDRKLACKKGGKRIEWR